MKIGNIGTTNPRGQIVIPASIRTQLGITDQIPLQFLVKGNALYILPIKDVVTMADSDSSYLDILEKTKGTWRKEKTVSTERKKIELQASVERKQTW